GLAGRGGDAGVEVVVPVQVREGGSPADVGEGREHPGEERAAAAHKHRELAALQGRAHAVANPLRRRDDGRVADDARLRITVGAGDADVQVAAVACADGCRKPRTAHHAGCQLGPAGLADAVDRHPDHRSDTSHPLTTVSYGRWMRSTWWPSSSTRMTGRAGRTAWPPPTASRRGPASTG